MSGPADGPGTTGRTADGSGAMFDRIARRYDLLNRINSLGLDRGWRRRAVAAIQLAPGSEALDLACGTADLAVAMARGAEGVTVVGVDPSEQMLALGRDKVAAAGLADRVRLEPGDAQALRFDDDRFDAVGIAFGIRNVPDRAAALLEMARVTRPQGRVVVLELTEPDQGLLGALARFHVHRVVPRIGALLSGSQEYAYLKSSIEAFPAPDVFAELLQQCGIDMLSVERLGFGACHLFVGRPKSD